MPHAYIIRPCRQCVAMDKSSKRIHIGIERIQRVAADILEQVNLVGKQKILKHQEYGQKQYAENYKRCFIAQHAKHIRYCRLRGNRWRCGLFST